MVAAAAPCNELSTVGDIARLNAVDKDRVLYVLRTRQHIRAAQRAGNIRLFDDNAKQQIRRELARIDARRNSAE